MENLIIKNQSSLNRKMTEKGARENFLSELILLQGL